MHRKVRKSKCLVNKSLGVEVPTEPMGHREEFSPADFPKLLPG